MPGIAGYIGAAGATGYSYGTCTGASAGGVSGTTASTAVSPFPP